MRLSARMSAVGTVPPHAVVGYCILWRLTSTQDVPPKLLGKLFFVFFTVKWIDCFRAVSVCVCACMRASLRCKQFTSALKPWLTVLPCVCVRMCVGGAGGGTRDGCSQCVYYLFLFSVGYRVFWVVMTTSDNDSSPLSSQRRKTRDANCLSPSGTEV